MWIKICGMTSERAVAAALAAGADAIGFVFAPSARGRVRCVAVTRHPTQAELDALLREFRPDVLQTDALDLEALRLPEALEQLAVLRSGAPLPAPLPRRLLYEGPASGSGTLSDWPAAGALAQRTQLVLAGGLDARNVAHAIAVVQPFGVDVSSGVEERPGVKNAAAIGDFVAAARAAAAQIEPAAPASEGS